MAALHSSPSAAGPRCRSPGAVLVAASAATTALSLVQGRSAEVFAQARQPQQLRGVPVTVTGQPVQGAASNSATSQHSKGAAAVCAFAGVAVACAGTKKHLRRHGISDRPSCRNAGNLADCPYTVYGEKDVRVSQEREGSKGQSQSKTCPLEVRMPEELAGDLEGQREYFARNLPRIYRDLREHGAIVFRGFELSKEAPGFQQVGQALELEACEDPLHSVAARDAVDQKAGVYEAVNKPSRRKFYVGMHNEMVGNRAPGSAIFVCFKAAEEGGEFLIADGREMFRQLDADWLETIYAREVMYSTAEFPMGFLEQLGPLQGALEPLVYGAMQQALKFKVDFETKLLWERSEYDGSKILQVRAAPQVPIVRHPHTGEPAWWGSMHSHAEYLRREREKVFGDEGFAETTGASRINKTDVYYADNGEKVGVQELKHLDQITNAVSVPVKMQAGDMVLLDNYMVMHGRCPFEGIRKHAVTWYKAPDYSKAEP